MENLMTWFIFFIIGSVIITVITALFSPNHKDNKKYRALCNKYGCSDTNKLYKKGAFIGMSINMLEDFWGSPSFIEEEDDIRIYGYNNGDPENFTTFLFKNNKLSDYKIYNYFWLY